MAILLGTVFLIIGQPTKKPQSRLHAGGFRVDTPAVNNDQFSVFKTIEP